MAEDEEEAENLSFEEMMDAAEERRENRRNQYTFEEIETIRSAGEVYRELCDVGAVADEFDLSEGTTRELLTIYRLVFEEPPYIRKVSVDVGRRFFSLEKEMDEEVDEDVDEPVEHLLREYVGAVLLENDIEDEPVSEPVEDDTPPLSDERSEKLEKMAESITVPTGSLLAASTVANLQETIQQTQAQAVARAVQPLIEQRERMLASAMQPLIEQRQRMLAIAVQPLLEQRQQMLAASLAPLASMMEDQQKILNSTMASVLSSAVADIQFPEPIIADLASIQPSVSAAAVAASTPPATGSSIVDEASTTTVETQPLEASATTAPSTSPVDATMDATLPDSEAFSTELAFEIPAMLVQSMLGAGPTRDWFNSLPKGAQQSVIGGLMVGLSYYFTQDLTLSGVAATVMTPGLREILTDD
ncbi:hypothetical protein [Halostella pelagica]|uniref:hypothetical protein n=1 Tax=Halostella pelagica TaxID=2583824 RepID=UPI001082018C|nr:hypothetical protein [Halostella pelagica]